jgi:hypothetical protein
MVQSTITYLLISFFGFSRFIIFNTSKKIVFVYPKKKTKLAHNLKFISYHLDKTSIWAVFFKDCFTVASFENWFCGNRLKKIASNGVWGNGRLPQLNLPSALAVAKQVCSFLFAYRNVDFNFVYLANKKLYSCGQIWFLRMPDCSFESGFSIYYKCCLVTLWHLQKTMN